MYVVAVILVEHLLHLFSSVMTIIRIILPIRTHVAECIVDVARRVLSFLTIIALGVDEIDDASAQELLRQVVGHAVLSHKGVTVAHALQDERHDNGHRHGGLLVRCAVGAVVGLAIVGHIVAQVTHGVVGTVATHRTSEMQFFSQAILLDKAVGGQCHRAALRVTYAYALPTILEIAEREQSYVIFI